MDNRQLVTTTTKLDLSPFDASNRVDSQGERWTAPSPDNLAKIADLLEVSIDDLYEEVAA